MSEPACHILSKTGQIVAGANLRLLLSSVSGVALPTAEFRLPDKTIPCSKRGLHRLATSPIGKWKGRVPLPESWSLQRSKRNGDVNRQIF